MPNLAANAAFLAYAIALIVLSLNLLLLWAYSGSVRGKTKTTPNAEDAATILKGSQLVEGEPPTVARVLRAHANASASILPFALLGLVYVLTGPSGMAAAIVFGVFTVARLGHSFAYVASKQPWRSISFTLGGLATLALIVLIVRQLIAAGAA
jgi:microsomal prostaglandin-E synthase 1